MATERGNSIDERAAELTQFSAQQLLGYIAALLEVVVANQADATDAILTRLDLNTFSVEGAVSIQ